MGNSLLTYDHCPFCASLVADLGEHIRSVHGEAAYLQAVLDAKRQGMSDAQVGQLFGITFRQLEALITRMYGLNISLNGTRKRITHWQSRDFRPETTTVWSFPQRGNWATHDGRYRGNWSPYIPRNLILRYSEPGDLVLDPFVGGGTTAVEAKLLGRRCIARDINPACVELACQNLQSTVPGKLFDSFNIFEPDVKVGDARNLSDVADESVDLICAHPLYAGIIRYSAQIEGDLSRCNLDGFLREMEQVAREFYRVLKPGKICAVLIGDTRQHRRVVPMGFCTMDIFLNAGFRLKELVIKRQHNCKTTGFWRERSIQHHFLLLAHEYLPVFEKPSATSAFKEPADTLVPALEAQHVKASGDIEPETTSVWILPEGNIHAAIAGNLTARYGDSVWYLRPSAGTVLGKRSWNTRQTLHSMIRQQGIATWQSRCRMYV